MATKNDIIDGLRTLELADNFVSIEIKEMVDEKEVGPTVEYRLKSGLLPSAIQRAKDAIVKVARDNGITVTSTTSNISD